MRRISPNIFEFHEHQKHALGGSLVYICGQTKKIFPFVNMKMQLIHGDQKRKAKANDEIKTAND